MDSTAISLCMDNSLPIIVFDLKGENILRLLLGEEVGTLVHSDIERRNGGGRWLSVRTRS